MKSARERAGWFAAYAKEHPDEDATWRLIAEFKEHAENQRQNCAASVDAAAHADKWATVDDARPRLVVATLSAPAPGEKQ